MPTAYNFEYFITKTTNWIIDIDKSLSIIFQNKIE
jgi:hypothetical protein